MQMNTSLVKEENIGIKKEKNIEMDCDTYMHLESKPFVKDELRSIKNEFVNNQKGNSS